MKKPLIKVVKEEAEGEGDGWEDVDVEDAEEGSSSEDEKMEAPEKSESSFSIITDSNKPSGQESSSVPF